MRLLAAPLEHKWYLSSPRTQYAGSRLFRPRTGALGDSPEPGGEGDYRAQAELLNRLYYSAATTPETGLTEEEDLPGFSEDAAVEPGCPGLLRDVPLWRVQWAALPAFQEVLHVFVPHYTDMFSRLISQPRPWRFGHLYLPSGSANLGSPEYELSPGSQAPLVGTLMEVLQAVNFPDGRLLVLAVGVGRFKVLRARQATPHSRADIVLLPDWEEVQAQQGAALEALEEGVGGDLPVAAAMQASVAASEQAAAAASQVWWQYEVASVAAEARKIQQDDVISASNEAEAQAFGRLLVGIGNQPVAPLPLAGPGSAQEEWPSDSDDEGAGPHASNLPDPMDCAACAAAADAAALAAAMHAVAALTAGGPSAGAAWDGGSPGLGLGLGGWVGGADTALLPGLSLVHASSGPLQGINSTAERGVKVSLLEAEAPAPPEPPGGAAAGEAPASGEGGISGSVTRSVAEDIGAGASRSVALRLEELAWRELDAVCHLAARIRSQPVPLGEGLAQLRPPGAAAPEGSGAEMGGQAQGSGPQHRESEESLHPSYPPVRRAQRLSYALASILDDVSNGRQALLEAPSISARLRLALAALRRHRSVLAAVVAVQGLSGEGPDQT